jgi:integrase
MEQMTCIRCGQIVPSGPFCIQCGQDQNKPVRAARRRGNGTGTVFRRGNTWTAQHTLYMYVDDQGVKRRKYQTKGGFATKKEAILYLEDLSNANKKQAPKLIELWESFEATRLPKLSRNKQTAYKKARERLDGIMGTDIDQLTTIQMQSTIDQACSSYYTARDCKTLLSQLYKAACADQYVPSNLARYIVLPALDESEAEPFTADEVQRIWAAYGDGNMIAAAMLVMVYSGMMPGELFALKKKMVDLDKREIIGAGKKTKTRKDTPLIFADCIVPVLSDLMDSSQSEKVICRQKDAWYKDYHEATQAMGIRDLPPYSCRHTTGTEAARLGLNAPTIQKVMRHAKLSTSQRYIHLGDDAVRDALNQFDLPKNENDKKV